VIEQAIKWGLTTWFRQTGDEQSFTSTQLWKKVMKTVSVTTWLQK
jgi:hypothetical protein